MVDSNESVRKPWAIVPAERGRGRPLGIDVDELLVLGDFGEGVDPRLIDGEPMGDEIVSHHGGEFAGRNALDVHMIAHS